MGLTLRAIGWRVTEVSRLFSLMSRRDFLAMLLVVGAMLPATPVLADKGDDGGDDGGGDDGGGDDGGGDDSGSDDGGGGDNKEDGQGGKRARDAVRSGEAVPLRDILEVVHKSYKGEVVFIKFSGTGSKLVYNIRLLDPSNRLIDVRVSAKSRRIIGVKGV